MKHVHIYVWYVGDRRAICVRCHQKRLVSTLIRAGRTGEIKWK